MNKKTIIYSIKSALPIITGYIVLSIGFGLLLQGKGYGCEYYGVARPQIGRAHV